MEGEGGGGEDFREGSREGFEKGREGEVGEGGSCMLGRVSCRRFDNMKCGVSRWEEVMKGGGKIIEGVEIEGG